MDVAKTLGTTLEPVLQRHLHRMQMGGDKALGIIPAPVLDFTNHQTPMYGFLESVLIRKWS